MCRLQPKIGNFREVGTVPSARSISILELYKCSEDINNSSLFPRKKDFSAGQRSLRHTKSPLSSSRFSCCLSLCRLRSQQRPSIRYSRISLHCVPKMHLNFIRLVFLCSSLVVHAVTAMPVLTLPNADGTTTPTEGSTFTQGNVGSPENLSTVSHNCYMSAYLIEDKLLPCSLNKAQSRDSPPRFLWLFALMCVQSSHFSNQKQTRYGYTSSDTTTISVDSHRFPFFILG
ncbi:hypothetical protein F5878DRAFT_39465 [Lentinula raphanica]|uniref:Uncharacterized protein n=1 Tax=Lentinula raphanica TaxID=153919 RepID=A0AA38NWK8_9AGAR|nr:hypothetical protein F5878DRAFT_39465 [Lentinula raphanica]